MEQIVKVYRICENDQAEVIHVRQSACSGDCHKCSGCGAAKETLIVRAENPIHAPAGAMVRLRSDTTGVLKAAALVYLMPIVMFFVGYAVGTAAGLSGAAVGCVAFAFGIGLTVMADRYARKHQKTVYTITGYAFGEG